MGFFLKVLLFPRPGAASPSLTQASLCAKMKVLRPCPASLGLTMHKTIAFDATYCCGFLFCHVRFDFTDSCPLDSFFQRLCRAGFDPSFCRACLVSDLGQTYASARSLLKERLSVDPKMGSEKRTTN